MVVSCGRSGRAAICFLKIWPCASSSPSSNASVLVPRWTHPTNSFGGFCAGFGRAGKRLWSWSSPIPSCAGIGRGLRGTGSGSLAARSAQAENPSARICASRSPAWLSRIQLGARRASTESRRCSASKSLSEAYCVGCEKRQGVLSRPGAGRRSLPTTARRLQQWTFSPCRR